MDHDILANNPITMARDLLGEALQEVGSLGPDEPVNIEQISTVIGDALARLVEAESSEYQSFAFHEKVVDAMGQLQQIFDVLQTAAAARETCAPATEKIAKTLALLYPIVKSHDSPSRIPESPFGEEKGDSAYSALRTAKRLAIEADIGFQSETNFFMGFTEDISTGGLFIATYDVRERGSTLTINFSLPNGHLVSADGIVRWVREYNESTPDIMPGMGVQFESLSQPDKEAIHRFTEQRAPLFYE